MKKEFEDLYNRFFNDCYKVHKKTTHYNFNLLDEQCGSVKENTHTNILMKLLEYRNQYGYVFLDDYIVSLTGFDIERNNNAIVFKKEYFNRTTDGKSGRIDGLIYEKNNFAIIIENKINGADNQEQQIKRYIEAVVGEGLVSINQVFVIFLTQAGVENPDKEESINYMLESGILDHYDDQSGSISISGPRYFACSYREHILPWLEERVWPMVMQKEQMLNTGVVQYIDFIKGMLGLRDEQTQLMKESVKWFDDEKKKRTELNDNKYLHDFYVALPSYKNGRNESEIKESEESIKLLQSIIEEAAEEPMRDFLNHTEMFFTSGDEPLIPKGDYSINHHFTFYYINIRNKKWPSGYSIGWYPCHIFSKKPTATLYIQIPSKCNDTKVITEGGFEYNPKAKKWQIKEARINLSKLDIKELKDYYEKFRSIIRCFLIEDK